MASPLLRALCLAALAVVPGTAIAGKEKPRPNVIVILADDLGWSDSTVYGSTYYETPALERLAREGMRFTDAYAASPLCSPTRASIMTGQYPARLHLTEAITPNRATAEPNAVLPKENQYCGDVGTKDHLPLEVRTLAEALKQDGYTTAHIGKWHLSTPKNETSEFDAGHRGFDFVIGGDHLAGPPDYYSPYRNGKLAIPNLTPGPEGEYLNERLSAEAIKWLDSVRDAGKPFYLNLWPYAVHGPIVAKKSLLPKYRAKTDPRGLQDCPEMATMIESLDSSVGLLLDWLDRPENHEIKSNTMVVFVSDNGGVNYEMDGFARPTSNLPLRGGKANTYEGGTRVPWIMSWPGHITPGSTNSTPVSTVDLYPTILQAAGAEPPAGQSLDGVSLVPLLEGGPLTTRPIFFDFPHDFSWMCAPSASVRLGDFKLLRFYWAGENAAAHHYELFDLSRDPGETVNLAEFMPDKVRELDALIEKHLQETGALTPIQNAKYRGNPVQPRNQKPGRPASISLDESDVAALARLEGTGSRKIRLRGESNNPLDSSALVIEGDQWVQAENLPDGSVDIRWDTAKKTVPAKILFSWRPGNSARLMNDWTIEPCTLDLR
ncbi:MAG: sulfatase [Verrucomicrobiota bacterium]